MREIYVPRCRLWFSVAELVRQLRIPAGIRLPDLPPSKPVAKGIYDLKYEKPQLRPWVVKPFVFPRGSVREALNAYCLQTPGLWWHLDWNKVVLISDENAARLTTPAGQIHPLKTRIGPLRIRSEPVERIIEAVGKQLEGEEEKRGITISLSPTDERPECGREVFPGRFPIRGKRTTIDFPGGSLEQFFSQLIASLNRRLPVDQRNICWAYRQARGDDNAYVDLAAWAPNREERTLRELLEALLPPMKTVILEMQSGPKECLDSELVGTVQQRDGYIAYVFKRSDFFWEIRRRQHYRREQVDREMVRSGVIREVLQRTRCSSLIFLLSIETPAIRIAIEDALLSFKLDDDERAFHELDLVPLPSRFARRYEPIWKRMQASRDPQQRDRVAVILKEMERSDINALFGRRPKVAVGESGVPADTDDVWDLDMVDGETNTITGGWAFLEWPPVPVKNAVRDVNAVRD